MGMIERFLIAATYSGVDLFFFISAFSLVSRPVEDYPRFIANRAIKLLPLFAIALLFGRFLWFIPAIMIMYLLLPPLYGICRRKPRLSFFVLMFCWAGTVYLVMGVIKPSFDIEIFLFRIPSIILGAYAVKYKERLNARKSLTAGILLLVTGIVLVYRYGYLQRLNIPFDGTFYLMGIPLMLGTVFLVDLLSSKWNSGIINRFGRMTLELYFSQMVLGTFFVNLFYGFTGSRIATNVLVFASVTAVATIIYHFSHSLMAQVGKPT